MFQLADIGLVGDLFKDRAGTDGEALKNEGLPTSKRGRRWSLRRRLNTWRVKSIAAGLVAYVLSVASFFLMDILPLTVAALQFCAPWIAVWLTRVSEGRLKLQFLSWPPAPGDLLAVPSMTLGVVGAMQYGPENPWPFVAISAGLGFLLGILFFRATYRRRSFDLTVLFAPVFLAGSSFGLLATINGAGPQDRPLEFEAQVLDKRLQDRWGRHASGSYRMLLLAPDGSAARWVKSPIALYDHVRPGDRVCRILYPGSLGFEFVDFANDARSQGNPRCASVKP